MSEQPEVITPPPAAAKTKARRKPQRRRSAPRAATAAPPSLPSNASEFAGITATKCCDGCTAEMCVISTVPVCKHPSKTGDAGCGPVTIANREAAKKVIKRHAAEA